MKADVRCPGTIMTCWRPGTRRGAGSVAAVAEMHFERMAREYAAARPPYPVHLYDVLRAEGVIGPGRRVLEIGAGAGLATRPLVGVGSEVTALEPGPELAHLLRRNVPEVSVIPVRLEDAKLPRESFHSAVAATSMHWVDLSTGLPMLHTALLPGGWLAVWRHRFGDDSAQTQFRRRVAVVVSQRRQGGQTGRSDVRPTMYELAEGGWFEPVRTERWQWTIDLDEMQVRRLFRTFSDWNDAEVEAVAQAAAELGGRVTEHYQTVLHLLRRAPTRQA